MSIQGFLLVGLGLALLVAGGLLVLTGWSGGIVFGIIVLVATVAGTAGARSLEASKLCNHFPNAAGLAEYQRKLSDAATLSLGGSGSVAVPALRNTSTSKPSD